MKNFTKFIMGLAIFTTIFSCTNSKKTNLENLVSTEWTLDSVVTKVISLPLDTENPVSIVFSDSTTFAGNGGCNQYFGTFTTEGDEVIAIETKGRTMAMCPNIEFEDSYILALNGVTKFVAEQDKLVMSNSKGEVVFIFIPTKK